MKHISILALEGATMTSVDGSHQLFSRINDFLKYKGKESYYNIDLVGNKKYTLLNNGSYKIQPDKNINEIINTDLIIIPIICGDYPKIIKENEQFTDWIKKQYSNGAEIASLCVGSFILASTGLLQGKKCATHWASKNDFQTMFPAINVVQDTIITDENGIYTSGGNYSYLNLLLYIIEKHLGREMSVLASKMFEIDIERKYQNQFAIFSGQKNHNDKKVLKIQNFIEDRLNIKITVNELSEKFTIGRRTLERRFKSATGNSILKYIQRVKVEAVKKELESSRKTINEIVSEVGYKDVNNFRNLFKKYAGITPNDYRNKYNYNQINESP